jgi:hypothetical protein
LVPITWIEQVVICRIGRQITGEGVSRFPQQFGFAFGPNEGNVEGITQGFAPLQVFIYSDGQVVDDCTHQLTPLLQHFPSVYAH